MHFHNAHLQPGKTGNTSALNAVLRMDGIYCDSSSVGVGRVWGHPSEGTYQIVTLPVPQIVSLEHEAGASVRAVCHYHVHMSYFINASVLFLQ